jgi:hypothetical protein
MQLRQRRKIKENSRLLQREHPQRYLIINFPESSPLFKRHTFPSFNLVISPVISAVINFSLHLHFGARRAVKCRQRARKTEEKGK